MPLGLRSVCSGGETILPGDDGLVLPVGCEDQQWREGLQGSFMAICNSDSCVFLLAKVSRAYSRPFAMAIRVRFFALSVQLARVGQPQAGFGGLVRHAHVARVVVEIVPSSWSCRAT